MEQVLGRRHCEVGQELPAISEQLVLEWPRQFIVRTCPPTEQTGALQRR
jgi:hypothetical protein